jgi:ABC-type transport system involved in multi-copper enzyme maturation permease subunit
MNAAATDASASGNGFDGALVRRQIYGIFRLELRNHLLSRRGFFLYFLAFAPVALVLVWAFSPGPSMLSGPQESAKNFAFIFFGYLATSVFLGCLITFMSLFRSEILERSLHYYFLTPVRREVIVLGKYVTALVAISGVFALGTLMLYLLAILPWGLSEASRFLFGGPGMGHLATYVGVAVMACIGYGAIFQLAGLIFRNPIVPAAIVAIWEAINPVLPSWLKKISVIFYLTSLLPVPATDSVFAILAEPTPAWISVPGLLVFTAAVLAITSWWARRMEIAYGSEE